MNRSIKSYTDFFKFAVKIFNFRATLVTVPNNQNGSQFLQAKLTRLFNPFMQNIEKWQTYFKNLVVFTLQEF